MTNMEILFYQSYLAMIKGSRDSQMFRHIYILNNGKKKDILKNGELSCAYYVSSILKVFNLLDHKISPHATVGGLVKNMLVHGWKETKKLKPGNVLVWEDIEFEDKEIHSHIGFYLGKDNAISNRYEKGVPVIHHYTYNQKRKIIQILTHKIIK